MKEVEPRVKAARVWVGEDGRMVQGTLCASLDPVLAWRCLLLTPKSVTAEPIQDTL